MSATDQITEASIRDLLVRAMSDVFGTMLGYRTQLIACEDAIRGDIVPRPAGAPPQVVGMVGFLGEADGLLYLYLEEPFARECTRDMLGLSDADMEEIGDEGVNDAIGEITNMAVGGFKNGLCDAGFPCKLTVPSILRGTSLTIAPVSEAVSLTYSFECRGHPIRVDVMLKSGE
jgi:chemotaxis protein CheX